MLKPKTQNPKPKINPKIKFQNKKFLIFNFKLFAYFVICALSFVIHVHDALAQPISSRELINNAKQYDGKIVVYEGEVIGDMMTRGDYAWINVFDGRNAIGIWAHGSLLKDITYTGSYKSKGDWIEITGIFRRACPEHGGDLDIHAQAIRKTSSGRAVIEKLSIDKQNMIMVLFGALCLVWILSLFIRK